MSLISQFQKRQSRLKSNLLKGGLLLENEMRKLVAIKKGVLEDSLVTDNVQERKKNVLSVDVGSEGVSYAKFVDLGVKGQTFNYSRNGRAVYTGVGQRFAGRALENTRDEILAIIKS